MLTRTNYLLIRLNKLDSAHALAKIAGFKVKMLNLGMLLMHQKVKTESILIKICHQNLGELLIIKNMTPFLSYCRRHNR